MTGKTAGTAMRVVLIGVVLFPSAVGAQQSDEETPPAAAAAAAAEQQDTIREQTIYVPYDELRRVFEKKGRGVFLPYEEFQALWAEARRHKVPVPDDRPPVASLITRIDNRAIVEEDVVRVESKLTIELLSDGWHQIPLRLADAAVRSARMENRAARIIPAKEGGYQLLVQKTAADPRQLELVLEYAKAFSKAPGQNSVSFQAPQAPVNRWEIHVPQPGVKVNVRPLIAATLPPADAEQPPEETVVLAFVGAAATVQLDWNPKAEGASGLTALSSVQAEHELIVDEGVVRTRTRLAYSISRAELDQLQIEVPADHKVSGVFDANVRQWEVQRRDDIQQINVQLFQPARDQQNVTVELEKFTGDEPMVDLAVPQVRALGVGRQQGLVVVRLSSALRAEAVRRGSLLQVDASELPPSLARQKWAFSYRYAALPFDLLMRIEKVQPRIRADELVEAYLEPDRLTVDLLAQYHIERAGVFQLRLDVPEDFEVRQVRGHRSENVEPASVDSWYLDTEDKSRLVVNLSRKALGRVGLMIELQRRLEDANLLTPTGDASLIALPVPRVVPDDITDSTGRLIVYAPESLRVRPSEQGGLQNIPFSEALQAVPSMRGQRFPSAREVLAFAYSGDPVQLTLSAQRRRPQVEVRQLLRVQVDEGVVRYAASFFYEIRYSGLKSLRIDVPATLAGDIRNETNSVREQAMDPAPDDVAEGYVAWQLTGDAEFFGQSRIDFRWEQTTDELEVGSSIEVDLPVLRPMQVDRAWGQITLAKEETLDVRATGEPKGLRPIDPQHDLMPEAKEFTGAARAFEFQDEWSLRVMITRYDLEEVKHTSIEQAVLRMVVVRSNQVDVQALYRMRNSVRQRLAVTLPEKAAFDSQPLRINGRPVTLESGDNELFIPLVGLSADEPFLLELRYTVPGTYHRLEFPEFPSEPAVQKVSICAFLPEELTLIGYRGPWTDETSGRRRGWEALLQQPFARQDADRELVQQTVAGIDVVGDPAGSFHTAGRLYVFSTLRPDPPAKGGSLRLIAFKLRWLNVLVFGGLAVIGLVFLARPVAEKLVVLGLLITALVLCGVFLPTFARQILDENLGLAILLVLLAWLLWFTVRVLPRQLAGSLRQRRAAAAVAASGAAVPPVMVATEPAPPAESGSPFAGSPEDEAGKAEGGPPPGDTSQVDEAEEPGREGGTDHA